MAAEKTSGDTGKMIYKQFDFEVKALTEDKDYHFFEGYLSTYGNVDRVGEVMDKGCFDESIAQLVPMLLWQHKATEVVGVFTEVRSDESGLWVKGKMPKSDTLVSGRIFPQMQVGSVRSMSVGFIPEDWEYKEEVKHHTKVMLIEGSLVAFPANPRASIYSMKSAYTIEDVEEIKSKRDFEKLLRESGAFSKKAVVYLASKFKEDEQQGDPAVLEPTFKSFLSELESITNKIKGI